MPDHRFAILTALTALCGLLLATGAANAQQQQASAWTVATADDRRSAHMEHRNGGILRVRYTCRWDNSELHPFRMFRYVGMGLPAPFGKLNYREHSEGRLVADQLWRAFSQPAGPGGDSVFLKLDNGFEIEVPTAGGNDTYWDFVAACKAL